LLAATRAQNATPQTAAALGVKCLMRNAIEHPIVASVIGGLILWAFAWIADSFVDTNLVSILTYPIVIPVGILLPLAGLLVFYLAYLRKQFADKPAIAFPPVSSQFYVDIRPRHDAVQINHPGNASVQVYLDVRNESPLPVVMDRIVAKFGYGIEMATLKHLRREVLEPWEKREIYITEPITKDKIEELVFQYNHNSRNCWLELYVECLADESTFQIDKKLEGIKPRFLNEQLLIESDT
jgi:hypothetical protein